LLLVRLLVRQLVADQDSCRINRSPTFFWLRLTPPVLTIVTATVTKPSGPRRWIAWPKTVFASPRRSLPAPSPTLRIPASSPDCCRAVMGSLILLSRWRQRILHLRNC